MFAESTPLVTVGLPVYNGENYLRAALDSILGQTYSHLELIITDNASTDSTRAICEEYAAKDVRIRYYRNERNLGAAPNYNLTLERAAGYYFKWAAHDDICAPTFIERCVEILERQPGVSLAYPQTVVIDGPGNVIDDSFEDGYDLRQRQAHHRYKAFTMTPLTCNAVFGVMRTAMLRKTPGIGSYESSDRVLLGELALLGEIAEVPERLFLRRYHSEVSTFAARTKKDLAAWFDPSTSWHFTRVRRFIEYVKSIRRVPLPLYQRCWCMWFLILFYFRFYLGASRWAKLYGKLHSAFKRLFSVSTIPSIHLKRKGAY